MKKILFFALAGALLMTSCEKSDPMGKQDNSVAQQQEISIMNGVVTKGYTDGVKFYEKSVATLHDDPADSTARTMILSAYLTPQEGTAGNYFVGEEFSLASGDDVWRHDPAYYWPLGGKLDFLAYSSTEPFDAKDAIWNSKNASSSLILTFDSSRSQDDVLFSAVSAESSDASDVSSDPYVTAKPVSMQYEHAQAWLEFQLSIAQTGMEDKIAIKEIIIENATQDGKLTLNRNTSGSGDPVNATWSENTSEADIVFDDSYSVYGHLKEKSEYTTEYQAVQDAQDALTAAQEGGDATAIATAEATLATAEAALKAQYEKYELVNPLNVIGAKRNGGTASAVAETATTCAYLDMLVPEQNKCDFIIRYILAGRPDVLEYKLSPNTTAGANWEMGKKYIYDIDFVISEITVAPSVTQFEASFDGKDEPIEIL